jgi:hypothetical protein
MTATQDMFVGMVGIVLGGLLVLGASLDAAVLMRLSKSQMLVERIGRPGARAVIAACGVTAIVMGGLIASGWRAAW